jgi:tetratricopeptide (TPR) repeat protein
MKKGPLTLLPVLFCAALTCSVLSCSCQALSKQKTYLKEQETTFITALADAEKNHSAGAAENLQSALFRLANNYIQQERYADAEPILHRALELAGSDKKGYLELEWLGYAALKQDRFQEALEMYRRALSVRTDMGDPHNLECRGGMSRAYLGLGNFGEAEKVLQELVKKGEHNEAGPTVRCLGQYLGKLACVLEKTGRESEAEACFKQALSTRPDAFSQRLEAEIRQDYADFLKAHGRASEASKQLGSAREILKRLDERDPHLQY